jgi:hypothetical protein
MLNPVSIITTNVILAVDTNKKNIHLVQNHRFSYNEAMSVESTTQALCNLALKFGEGESHETMVKNI